MTGKTPQDVSHKINKRNWKARGKQFRWDQLGTSHSIIWQPQQLCKITILKIEQILQKQILLTLSPLYKQPWWRNQLFSGNYFSWSEQAIWIQGSRLPCFFHCNLYLAWRCTVFFPSPFFFQKFHLNVDQCEVISIKALPIDIQLKRDISSLSQGSK